MAETFRPPQGVRDEAARALAWIADGKAGAGFTDTGRARAAQLARGDAVSADTILRMYSFFARHEGDKQGQGFNVGDEGYPSAGRVAWAAWGGDAGFSWSSKIREQLSARVAQLEGESMESRDIEETETVSNLPEELTELLGTAVQFYFRAHGAHWNVKGADFSEYHKLFQKIYETAYDLIDPIAENLRKIGAVACSTLTEFASYGYLKDATPGQDPMALARDLRDANDVFLDQLSDVFYCATNYNQQGIANFIASAIDGQQYFKWQLTASLGEEVTEPAVDPVDVVGLDADDDSMSMPSMELVAAYSAEIDSLVTRAMADSVKVGSFVSWNNGTARARGKVEKVVTTGTATSSDGFTMDANADKPVFVIRIYSSKDNGYVETDTTVLHFADVLTVTDDLPSPRNENIDMESRKSRMASAERVTMDCEVRAIATDSTSLRIGGYAAQFNKEATGLSFREVIAPGAFTRTLQSGEPVFLLVNHDTDNLPLASTQSGTMALRQDETGLWMEADLDPNNPRAQELASAVSRGDVSKMSFAFTVEPGGDTREAGLRTLQDLNLFEVSVVTWPAYDATTVGMRTASAEDAEAEALELRKRMLDLKQKFSNSKNR
jgi:HK97 family phage prohead protease